VTRHTRFQNSLASLGSLLVAGLVIAMLSGCGGTAPVKPAGKTPPALSPDRLLQEASTRTGDTRNRLLLDAAQGFARQSRHADVLDCLGEMQSPLLDAVYAESQWRQAQAHLALGDSLAAAPLLREPRLMALLSLGSEIPAGLKAAIAEVQAQVFLDLDDTDAALVARAKLAHWQMGLDATSLQYYGLGDAARNQEQLWQGLLSLPQARLQGRAPVAELDGWYQLALIARDRRQSLSEQYAALTSWQRSWPRHPARQSLPGDLAWIEMLIQESPQHIALLLPLTGDLAPVAQAVRDGFMAAFYSHQNAGNPTPEIRFYDLGRGDIAALYDQAVAEGAEVVIGPLHKEAVQALANRASLPVPTLALNQIGSEIRTPDNLYQLGLSVEDEAFQVAQQAFAEGKRRALVISPASAQSDRATAVFKETWRALGGLVAGDLRFADTQSLSGAMRQSLGVQASEQRAAALQAVIGDFDFQPRARDDLDLVFIAAEARDAKHIKPLLSYHYAQHIPVYGTSALFEGEQVGQDLNGISLGVLPWFFNDTPEKAALLASRQPHPKVQRLFALGVDAFYIYPRLAQMAETRTVYWGQTGLLRLNQSRQFLRQLQWARYKNGTVKLQRSALEDGLSAP
jgi:uncharacterized protein